jgi:hypothetical protein
VADKQPRFRVVDVPTVHEVYSNQFISAGFDGSSVTITLGTTTQMPERMGEGIKEGNQPIVYVSSRLAISAPAMLDFITSVSSMLEKIGVTPAKVAKMMPTDSGRLQPPAAAPGSAPFSGDTWGR